MLSAGTIRVTRKTRVAYAFAFFAKGWGIARCAMLLAAATTSLLQAQSAPCGITSITDKSQFVYPPIARAAHIGGSVILLARFAQDGTVANATVISGPPMLRDSALEFVKSWRANAYTGPRECPMVIDFNLISDKPVCTYEEAGPPQVTRSDVQHVSVSVRSIWTCDPSATITKTRKRWF